MPDDPKECREHAQQCAELARYAASTVVRRETSGKGELPKQISWRLRKPIELRNRPWQFPQG
jgi:hypothetical protein